MALKLKKSFKRIPQEETPKKETAPEKPKKKSTLPPDHYKDEIEKRFMVVDEFSKLVFSVRRGGDLGLPEVDVRHYQTTEKYEGFTKKGIKFPLEQLADLIDQLKEIYEECEDLHLE